MSDAAQPLSRRERRAMEEAARAAEGDETQALPIAPETESVVSRRERRRMERLAHPVETWTAEEEMIATGQMPAMTPEVIAEQERIAREKAAQADADARAAAADVQPTAHAVIEPMPEAQPEAEQAAQPEAEPEAEPEQTAAEPELEYDGGIPADLRHLFPSGSLQARAFEAAQAQAAPVPTPLEPVSTDAVEEIRRLSQEAMAGLSRAAADASAAEAGNERDTAEPKAAAPQAPESVATEPEPAPEPEQAPYTQASVVEAAEGVDVEALWNAPTVDEPVRTPIFPEALASSETVDPAPLQFEPAEPAPVESAPAQNVQNAQNAPVTPERAAVTPLWGAPAPAAQAGSSLWDTHPLTHPGGTPVRELPTEAVKHELPRPDLTTLLATQATPVVGRPAATSTETTGAILRPLPEPQAGGGARHFRWAHLAVIGAIAFVLGVVAWNIARSGS